MHHTRYTVTSLTTSETFAASKLISRERTFLDAIVEFESEEPSNEGQRVIKSSLECELKSVTVVMAVKLKRKKLG